MLTGNVTLCENAESLAQNAATFIKDAIENCVSKQSYCRIALPGGNTPARCLQILSAYDLPWSELEWYMGDERCLAVDHAERNDGMIKKVLFASQPDAINNFFPMKAELGAEKAAEDYSALIKPFVAFDIVILGMGEDGHTASLFPGNKALQDTRIAVPVYNAPKPPAERVSLSLQTLSDATLRVVLIAGENKKDVFNRMNNGEQLPVNSIGENQWFVDKAIAN